MGYSHRIKTEIGINKTINVELEQDFNQIEILSLKFQQEDVYNKSCADYGVIVGRITANNGFGIPNARVSVFIPIENQDRGNPEITSIYPYTSPEDKNEDGYRYNLLSHEKSYPDHAATGTLPTVEDVLTDRVAMEIYDKYYRYTVKTNESGDYMIMGAPLGTHTVFLDLDLSDIGEFSLTPQDLIRIGRATEAQVAGSKFKSSNDLNSLPQIVSISKSVDVSPLWGDPSTCQIAITRVDFDLRDDANIDIQPTAVFMGSIISTENKYKLRKTCRPKDDMGNLCQLQTGPGKILAIRQTINFDTSGNPILEEYRLEQSGNVIDGDGTWMVELPMNLDYVITNEFGEKVVSPTTSVGIPTKSKYRFKIMWQQPPTLSQNIKRAYYLVPNVREYGWFGSDPNYQPNPRPEFKKSYYFGLDWGGYANIDAAINCEDTFYLFEMNRVYTVSSFIDSFHKGPNRGNFLGIKEVNSPNCTTTTNKFPVNDGVRNFDLIYFIFSFLFTIIQLIGVPLLIIYHIVAFLWNNFAVLIIGYLIFQWGQNAIYYWGLFAGAVAGTAAFGATAGLIAGFALLAVLYTAGVLFLILKFRDITEKKFGRVKLAMITYPDCDSCECEQDEPVGAAPGQVNATTLLTQFSNSGLYYEPLAYYESSCGENDGTAPGRLTYTQILAGNPRGPGDMTTYKMPISDEFKINWARYRGGPPTRHQKWSYTLPIGERVNIFNRRENYFLNNNKIKVTFDVTKNNPTTKFHYDNTLTTCLQVKLESGTVLTFVGPNSTKDPNYLFSAQTATGLTLGISGTSTAVNNQTISVRYATSQTQLSAPVSYFISSGYSPSNYTFPSDLEYYQVITAMTIAEFCQTFIGPEISGTTCGLTRGRGWPENPAFGDSFYNVLFRRTYGMSFFDNERWSCLDPWCSDIGFGNNFTINDYSPLIYLDSWKTQYITIIQRGVDPYSPLYVNKYGIGKMMKGGNFDDITFTAKTRLNIPIQPVQNGGISVQDHRNPNQILYNSYFFTPGNNYSGFSTPNFFYYSSLDASNNDGNLRQFSRNNVNCIGTYENTRTQGCNSISIATAPGQSNILAGAYRNVNAANYFGDTRGYANNPDLSGAGVMDNRMQGFGDLNLEWIGSCYHYYSRLYFYGNPNGTVTVPTSNRKVIMRSDRLPSSDAMDGWTRRTPDGIEKMGPDSILTPLFAQNLQFAIYEVNIPEEGPFSVGNLGGGGDGTIEPDTDGVIFQDVLDTFKCDKMVQLSCYQNSGYNIGIQPGCDGSDAIEGGCYIFMDRPLRDLKKDLNNFAEWGYRYRFFFGLCRGILSEVFTNNWVNGTLYMFPFQFTTYFDNQNNPSEMEFCKELIYFDKDTNNFYYRSSPYSTTSGFGRKTPLATTSRNKKNLLYPTTIMNLGMKSSLFSQTSLEPSAKIFTVNDLTESSFADTSDLLNLFVISRVLNASFLQQLVAISSRAKGLSQLFSRDKQRIDGDLAQLLSINSEVGVIKFSPDFYTASNSPSSNVIVLNGNTNTPAIGVFYSSTTENLQIKDFLTPGILNFRIASQPNSFSNAITYPVPIITQNVPFYQWYLNDATYIFGNEKNDWATNSSDVFSAGYQSISRRTTSPSSTPSYFIGPNTAISDIYARGYIFNVDSTGTISPQSSPFPQKFLVGAPFHFYFGLINGFTAIDKFKTKYLTVE